MLKCLLFFAIAITIALPASAELTAQEKAEVLKIVYAAQKAESAVIKLSVVIRTAPAGSTFINKPALAFAIDRVQTLFNLRSALGRLIWAYDEVERTPRAESIALAWPQIDAAIRKYTEASQYARAVPAFVSAANDFAAAVALLQSIDRTLPYGGENPFPTSYPRVIGPHGDYDGAQQNIGVATRYLEHFMTRTVNKFNVPTYPNTAKSNYAMGVLYENVAKAFMMWIRVQAMKAGVVLPVDMIAAQFDQAASSGLRPVPFFIALRQIELVQSRTSQIKTFSGRTIPAGIAFFYSEIVESWRTILGEFADTDPTYVAAELKAGGSSFFAIAISWRALDEWGVQQMLFFHELPAPPLTP